LARRTFLLFLPLVALAMTEPADARLPGTPRPVLHEPIPPDAREDLALHVSLEGDLPAAIQTPSGLVSAPDPRHLPSASDAAYGAGDHDAFTPDRNTQRPEVGGYDEPFTPSTAPFKRLEAFDAVRSNYELYVRDPRLTPVTTSVPPALEDEAFYADLVVDVAPDRNVRIPSVGPGARIVRGRLGVGGDDVAFRVLHDGADNWFLQTPAVHGALRARLVLELAIARAAFGGQIADRGWGDLPLVVPLPDNVARDAAEARAAMGVSRQQRPREAIAKLVQYFRAFADSDDPPRGRGNVYLDLALSKKGVCRHRAFAFLVTAQSLGVPTRMVLNEAHAWVEVHDGVLWRRIDLGGAGHMANPASNDLPERAVYRPPPDAFSWPQNAERGEDMVADARARASALGSGGGPSSAGGAGEGDDSSSSSSPTFFPAAPPTGSAASGSGLLSPESSARDDRPPSVVTLVVDGANVHRGVPLHVRGEVRADGDPCAHVAVEVWLREADRADASKRPLRQLLLGMVATGDDGRFADGIVVPGGTALGDYDVVARTAGDPRCGRGASGLGP
jgi:hypothetical protein